MDTLAWATPRRYPRRIIPHLITIRVPPKSGSAALAQKDRSLTDGSVTWAVGLTFPWSYAATSAFSGRILQQTSYDFHIIYATGISTKCLALIQRIRGSEISVT